MPQMTHSNNQVSSPAFAGEPLGPHQLIAGGGQLDVSQFTGDESVTVVADGNAMVTATSISVDALSGPIPNGTVLYFGTGKFARLTAAAVAGATSLSVEALTAQVDDDDEAVYDAGVIRVPAGTYIGRTFAERTAGSGFGPAEASDDELYLTAFDVLDAEKNSGVELIRHNTIIREDHLPDWSTLGATLQAQIRADYATVKVS